MSRRKKMLNDLDRDIQEHIERETEDNIERGMSRADARTAALRKFGNVALVQEDTRAVWTVLWIEQFLQDLRFGLRMLRKSPGFTAIAVLTLALAIGANAVVFSALNVVILHPLDLPRAESLYSIHRVNGNSAHQSYPGYLDLRDRNRSFEDLAAYNILEAALDTGQNPSRAWLLAVSGNYFDVLDVQPYLGRLIHASDEHGANSAPYIVLSHDYWHTHFQDDRSVVGRVVEVNRHPFTIIGVAQPGFHGTLMFFNPAFFLPIVNQEQVEGASILNARGNAWIFMTLGHLKPGVTPQQAAGDVNAIGADLERTYPKDHGNMKFALARPSLYGDHLGRPVRAFLTALMLLAGLILLAACANLGSLFAARAADRSREVALRLALGAGRMRIVRQLFTEAILISLIGGAAGLSSSVVLLRWLSAWQPFPQYPMNLPVNPDANVYVAALVLAVASGFLFGAVPVRQVLRTDPYDIVKSGSRCTDGRRIHVRDVLVVAQIAICAVLVTSSMVAVRGLVRSLHSSLGIQPAHAMIAEVDLGMMGYRGDAAAVMQKRMLDAMETIPGVTSVGLINIPPLANGGTTAERVYADETADLRPANAAAAATSFQISPGYFRTAETALLTGRNITSHDDKNTPPVAVVNAEFARKLFGSVSKAIDRFYKMRDGTRVQIVGVVEDGKYENLTEPSQAAMFLPIRQSPSNYSWLVLRSNRDPQQLASAIKSKLRDLDSGLPSFIQTWDRGLDIALFPSRVAVVALGLLGLMAAMLSVTGVFGMAAYSVSQRLREFGIRMALGAQRKEVLQAALGRALKLLGFGSAAGLILGLLASSVLGSIVYLATPRDPLVMAGVVFAMLLLGLLATWIPAQRALSVNPLILLRED